MNQMKRYEKTGPLRAIALLTALSAHSAIAEPNADAVKPTSEKIVLDNGVTLLLGPLPEAKVVAVETFYPVGLCDEPDGMAQAAHLLEHLMCQGETRSYRPGESFDLIRGMGMANAETLPTFTHYDYIAPPTELSTILKIEAERLESLRFTDELLEDEIDKCIDEANYVMSNPRSGMLKYAMTGLCQFWRHGATEVRVRRALLGTTVNRIESLHRELYRPDELIVVIVGGFDPAEAVRLARQHLEPLKSPERSLRKPINWSSQPSFAPIVWDVDLHAVCIAAPPPDNADDRTILSLWGTILMQRWSMDSEIGDLSHMVFASNPTWPVGRLPFFVYAAAKSESDVPKLRDLLSRRLSDAAVRVPATDAMQVRMLAGQYSGSPIPPWSEVRKQAASLAKTTGQQEDSVTPLVLGNLAMQWGLRKMFGVGESSVRLSAESLSDERIEKVIREALGASRLRVVTLSPPKGPDGEK